MARPGEILACTTLTPCAAGAFTTAAAVGAGEISRSCAPADVVKIARRSATIPRVSSPRSGDGRTSFSYIANCYGDAATPTRIREAGWRESRCTTAHHRHQGPKSRPTSVPSGVDAVCRTTSISRCDQLRCREPDPDANYHAAPHRVGHPGPLCAGRHRHAAMVYSSQSRGRRSTAFIGSCATAPRRPGDRWLRYCGATVSPRAFVCCKNRPPKRCTGGDAARYLQDIADAGRSSRIPRAAHASAITWGWWVRGRYASPPARVTSRPNG